jgi:hypothetical protein
MTAETRPFENLLIENSSGDAHARINTITGPSSSAEKEKPTRYSAMRYFEKPSMLDRFRRQAR